MVTRASYCGGKEKGCKHAWWGDETVGTSMISISLPNGQLGCTVRASTHLFYPHPSLRRRISNAPPRILQVRPATIIPVFPAGTFTGSCGGLVGPGCQTNMSNMGEFRIRSQCHNRGVTTRPKGCHVMQYSFTPNHNPRS
jgi:hypothetical protein